MPRASWKKKLEQGALPLSKRAQKQIKRLQTTSATPKQTKKSIRKAQHRQSEIAGGEKAKQRSIRTQIRDTKRLLARDDLPETVRLTKERVLKSLEEELDEKLHEKKSKTMTKKYRRVKFFEKVKIVRKLKQTIAEYHESTDEEQREKILVRVTQFRQELNYVDNYPPEEKYLALHPTTETTSSVAIERREQIFRDITEMVEKGELPDVTASIHEVKELMSTSLEEDTEPERSDQTSSRQKKDSKAPTVTDHVTDSDSAQHGDCGLPTSKHSDCKSSGSSKRARKGKTRKSHRPTGNHKESNLGKRPPATSSDEDTDLERYVSWRKKWFKEDDFFLGESDASSS